MTIFSFVYLTVVSLSLGIVYLIGKPATTAAESPKQSGKDDAQPGKVGKRPGNVAGTSA